MPPFLLSLVTNKWFIVGVIILCAYGIGQLHGRGAVYEEWIAENEEAAKSARGTIVKQQVVTEKVVIEYRDKIVAQKGKTETIVKEVVRYVPASADPVLPVGWRMLHDRAAAAGPVSAPPEGTDVAAPDVASSVALTGVVRNYGACHATALQVTALQAWIRQQYQTMNLEALDY